MTPPSRLPTRAEARSALIRRLAREAAVAAFASRRDYLAGSRELAQRLAHRKEQQA